MPDILIFNTLIRWLH